MSILDDIRATPREQKRLMRPLPGAVVFVDAEDPTKAFIRLGDVAVWVDLPASLDP